jgi:hypothetical protein
MKLTVEKRRKTLKEHGKVLQNHDYSWRSSKSRAEVTSLNIKRHLLDSQKLNFQELALKLIVSPFLGNHPQLRRDLPV